ncbi:glycosyltransferase family 4 protein [Candidatus Kaiserbacteria bacterium]|nr:glycosyltransferase family 4 protein [Candidatus Kaiserbacteria bacterium]
MTKHTPLRILYVITKSNWGGAQKYVFELALAAKEAGHDVSVACGGTGEAGAALGDMAVKLNAAGIDVIPVPAFMRNMSFFNDFKSCFSLWKIIRKIKPDIIHVNSSKAGGIGAVAGRLAGDARIIFTSHGLTVDETWRPLWQRTLIYIGTWLTLRLAHHSIMISNETLQRASDMPFMSGRVSLIHNGIGQTKFLERSAARSSLANYIPQNAIWIGGVGELNTNKNWSVAIKAMKTIPASVHLVIIGAGEDRMSLNQLITQEKLKDRVHLLGHIEASPYLKAFDIFVLPSKKEGLPYVILEAGLAGLPVVASDLPGIRDIIETGQNGFLVEPTPDLLSTSLSMLVRDEGMRRRLGNNLQETVGQKFSINKMCDETFKIYSSNRLRTGIETGL